MMRNLPSQPVMNVLPSTTAGLELTRSSVWYFQSNSPLCGSNAYRCVS